MSVRAAVEHVETAPAPVTPAQMIRQTIDRQTAGFGAVLPAGFDAERFSRLVLTAVKATPQLMECFATPQGQTSVLLAAMQAATAGLEPNTMTQDCWITPRRNSGVWEAQITWGYQGLMTIARRSGEILDIYAEVVRDGDEFDVTYGLHRDLKHRKVAPSSAPLTHAYAVAHFKDGGFAFIVLDRDEVEARRARSDSWRNDRSRPYSPWTTSTDAMWRKSAVRAVWPYLPKSTQAASIVATDERTLRYDDEIGVITTVDETPALEAAPEPA